MVLLLPAKEKGATTLYSAMNESNKGKITGAYIICNSIWLIKNINTNAVIK